MSVKVKFECDGCDKDAWGKHRLASKFVSLSGRSYGFGSWHDDKIEDVTPDGWVAFDPYTRCCYCPECWADIAVTQTFESRAVVLMGLIAGIVL